MLRTIRKRKSIVTNGGINIFRNNCNGNRKSSLRNPPAKAAAKRANTSCNSLAIKNATLMATLLSAV